MNIEIVPLEHSHRVETCKHITKTIGDTFEKEGINFSDSDESQAEIKAVIDGREEMTYTTACRDANGQWQLQ